MARPPRGTDYAAISNFTVTIAAGASSGTATLSFDPEEDDLAEGDETVVLTGSAPSSLNLTAGTATLTITDNDNAPTAVTLAVNPASAAENADATAITVTALAERLETDRGDGGDGEPDGRDGDLGDGLQGDQQLHG